MGVVLQRPRWGAAEALSERCWELLGSLELGVGGKYCLKFASPGDPGGVLGGVPQIAPPGGSPKGGPQRFWLDSGLFLGRF